MISPDFPPRRRESDLDHQHVSPHARFHGVALYESAPSGPEEGAILFITVRA